jgi:hypothetical protein
VLLDTVLVRLLRTDGGFHVVGCILQMFNDLSSELKAANEENSFKAKVRLRTPTRPMLRMA